MGAQGTTIIDFGAEETHTSVVVTGQASIVAGSLVEAWIRPEDNADRTADEHIIASMLMDVVAGTIVAATGFTIYGVARVGVRLKGKFTVAWVWN
jgi:hypothetical protein